MALRFFLARHLFAVLIVAAFPSKAAEVRDNYGQVLCVIKDGGEIRTPDGWTNGKVIGNEIRDPYGRTLFTIHHYGSNTEIRDEYGCASGYISGNHDIQDVYGRSIGHIER